ncbi:hypothetical protein [Leptospira interrogans]|nr:hypothetical protein [Leptospira interrogans]
MRKQSTHLGKKLRVTPKSQEDKKMKTATIDIGESRLATEGLDEEE